MTSTRLTPSTPRSSRSKAAARGRERTAHKPLRPFTVDHFRAYGRVGVLENGGACELESFQLEVAEDIFAGAVETWMLLGEGNGKTTFTGLFSLYHADYTPGAAVLLGASSRDQCGLVLGQAAGFVYRTPSLRKRFRVFEGYRRIVALRTEGRIQVYAADDRTGDGVIPTLVLLDELHRHRDMRLYRTWRGKLDKRGGQLVAISTAGEPGSEFEQTIEHVRRGATATPTRDGHERLVNGEMVLHRWALPDAGDPDDFKAVKQANPLSTITTAALRRKRKAATMTDAHWRRFTCNQSVRGESAAISAAEWEAAYTDARPERGTPVFCGIDLGWTWDTTAIVPLWVPSADRRVLLAPTIITPPHDGTSTRPSAIHQALLDVHECTPIHTVAVDRAAGGEQLVEWIIENLGARVIGYSNGNTEQARCAARFYEGLRAEPEAELRHVGDAELTRQVLNARARVLPSGAVIFERPSQTRAASFQDERVIDGLSAAAIVNDAACAPDDARPFQLSDFRITRL
jgi:phage terminase large subunit-like protein